MKERDHDYGEMIGLDGPAYHRAATIAYPQKEHVLC